MDCDYCTSNRVYKFSAEAIPRTHWQRRSNRVDRVDKSRGTEYRAPLSSRQNSLHDNTESEFYVKYAIKFVHEHETFRRKPLKGYGRGRKGKERDPPGYFVHGPPSS